MERMHRMPSLACIPIVVITGTDDAVNRDRSGEIGAAAFLVKPIEGAALRVAVDGALRQSGGLA